MKRNMRILAALVLLAAWTLQPVIARADQKQPIAVQAVSYVVTDASVAARDNEKLTVSVDATAEGVIDCLDNQECAGMGLDGQTLSTHQSFLVDVNKQGRISGQIVIDVIGAGIVIDVIGAGFSGTVKGTSIETGPDTLESALSVTARTPGGGTFGIDLSAVINKATNSIVIDVIGAGIVTPAT